MPEPLSEPRHRHQWGSWLTPGSLANVTLPRSWGTRIRRIRYCITGDCPMAQDQDERTFVARPERSVHHA